MITLNQVSKVYEMGQQSVQALQDIQFTIEKGQLTMILGASGSGKSTLLNILGGMDRLTTGTFLFNQKEMSAVSDQELEEYRKKIVGFVFQFYNLVPSLTAYENIAIAAQLVNKEKYAESYLDKVGLTHRKDNFPHQLSGGEMQRVSIARALAKNPELLLCDEPTGALDTKTGEAILNLLGEVAKVEQTAVVMVTHNPEFVKYADKVIYLEDGRVKEVKRQGRAFKEETNEAVEC